MKAASRLVTVSVAGLLTGCVEVRSTRTSPVQYAAIRPEQVYVFQTEKEVPGPYENVGIIFTRVSAVYDTEENQIEAKKRAAEMGANGIILQNFTKAGTGALVAQALVGTIAINKGQILAIHFHPRSGG